MDIPEVQVTLRQRGVELLSRTLPPGEYVLGSDATADVRIVSLHISGRHARLTLNFDHALLEDLGSEAGTFVAEQRITDETRIYPSQPLRLGPVELELQRSRVELAEDDLAPSQALARRLLPQELFGERRYSIGRHVARGGMGAILEARQGSIQRTVAMKVMLSEADQRDLVRFIDEARITGQLDHPNIVPIYELGVDEHAHPFYTMKLVRGRTMKQVLAELVEGNPATAREFPLAQLLTVFQKTCDAIAFAHSRGVIHRDLKPENIMLGDFGSVLVMDWGLAKVIGEGAVNDEVAARSVVKSVRTCSDESDTGATMAGTVIGTPHYMSPEQARGEVERLDPRSDLYSLGAILFELIHLRRPLRGRTPDEVIEKAERGEIDWTGVEAQTQGRSRKLKAPDSLVAVCRKAMALRPEDRYSSVKELQADVTAFQSGFVTRAEKAGAWKQFRLFVRRHRAVSTSVAAALLLLAGVVTLFTLRLMRERDRAENSLARLRHTAPAFLAEARGYVEAGQLAQALERTSYAVELDPQNPEVLLRHAQYLESASRLSEAVEMFQRVLAVQPENRSAQQNLKVCQEALAKNGGRDELPVALLQPLIDLMLAEGRLVEANPIATRAGRTKATAIATLRARLKDFTSQSGWNDGRISFLPDGQLRVDLNGLRVSSLEALRGFPINNLGVNDPAVTDLSPLQGMPLTSLGLNNTSVSDLSPVLDAPLTALFIMSTAVRDHRILLKIPTLRELHLNFEAGENCSALQGLNNLEMLQVSGGDAGDLSKVSLPALREIDFSNTKLTHTERLAEMPLTRAWLPSCELKEIPPLPKTIRSLGFGGNQIADLTPLTGLPLKTLYLDGCPVTDLSPLRGMPLNFLNCNCSRPQDLSTLGALPELEEISLPRDFLHEEVLRQMPNLKRARVISYQRYAVPMQQFWAELRPELIQQAHARALIARAKLRYRNFNPLTIERDGSMKVDFTDAAGDDFPDLRGLPIVEMRLGRTTPRDLEFLRGLPLQRLEIAGCKVTDLSPLQGMPLQYFVAPSNSYTDLSPLRGMPLIEFNISFTPVEDLSPIAATKLQRVMINDTKVRDLSPLYGAPLEILVLHHLPVQDYSFVKDMPLKRLELGTVPIPNLNFLVGKELEYLNMSATHVDDPSALSKLPLKALSVRGGIDLKIILGISTLENLMVTGSGVNLNPLRAMPNLKIISYNGRPSVPAEQFFAEGGITK